MIAVGVLGRIATPLTMVFKAASAAASFFQIIDSEKILFGGLCNPDAVLHGDIIFRNVDFTYPTRTECKIFQGLNARFERAKTTALVGPSGAGKSTIVAMMERWYTPQNGSISVGELNIEELELKWWRSQIGLVQQEPFLFNDTIFNNISYGLVGTIWENESSEVKMKLVKDACKEGFAEEFIERLPMVLAPFPSFL